MKVLEKYLIDLLTEHPLFFVLFVLVSWTYTVKYSIDKYIELKEKMNEKFDLVFDRLDDLEDNIEDHKRTTTDKYNLISEKFSDIISTNMNKLIDRLSDNNKCLAQIITILEND